MNQPLGINKIIFCDTSTSDFYLIFIWSADYFLSCAHPKRKQPWLTKYFGVRLGKRHYACEVYNPRVMILDICSIIYKSNDPQISHLQNVLWVYKLFMRLGTCFETISGMHPYAWMAPAATVGLYLMSYAHLARRVSGPVQRLQLLIPEVLGSNPTSNLYLVFLLYLQVTILRIIINVRCSLIKKSEWSSGNTQYSQSGVHAFKPSWVQESAFFLNYKFKLYILLETNTFSDWGDPIARLVSV